MNSDAPAEQCTTLKDLRDIAFVVALFATAGFGYAVASLGPEFNTARVMSETQRIRTILMQERIYRHERGEMFDTWLKAHPDLACGYVIPKGAHFFDRSIQGKPPEDWGQAVRFFRVGTEFLGAMWFGYDGTPWTEDDEVVLVPARR